MAFIAYELSLNSEIQKKLYQEISSMHNNLNGDRIDYKSIAKLKYLDQVVSEVLRKWPPLVSNDRKCTKDFLYEDDENRRFFIKKGQLLYLPIYSIHHDPKYYSEPEKFGPSRKSSVTKANIK